MCFSERASIVTFIIGLIGSFLCVSLGGIDDKIIGYFFAFVSSMQLIEFLLWRHQKCDSYNRFLSISGMILNHLQPIVLGFIILMLNKNIRYKNVFYLSLFVYIAVIIPYSIQFIMKPQLQCTLKNDSTHLNWYWNHLNYGVFVYTVFLLVFSILSILGFSNLKMGIYIALFGILSFLLSLYFYKQRHVGAIWCYFVVFLPIIYYVLSCISMYVKQSNK